MTDLSDLITCLVVTSPTASDPSTEAFRETVMSLPLNSEKNPEWGRVRILVGADGVRPEQRHLTDAYEEKLNRLEHGWSFSGLLRLPHWGHQASVMRMLLAEVTTPLVLFMEHDTPLTPDVAIDWQTAAECILSRELDLIRFLHESSPLAEHAHLFIDRADEPQYFGTMPYLRTVQWSQRPHLAHAQWYRWIVDTYFAPSSRCFIEDVLHGVVATGFREEGADWLQRFRLAIYGDPEPTMQRSYHLDGRGGEAKGPQTFAYPGDTWPKYAPAPTLGRTWE